MPTQKQNVFLNLYWRILLLLLTHLWACWHSISPTYFLEITKLKLINAVQQYLINCTRGCVIVVMVIACNNLQPGIISVSRIVAVALIEFLALQEQLIYILSRIFTQTLDKHLFQTVIHGTVGCGEYHLHTAEETCKITIKHLNKSATS